MQGKGEVVPDEMLLPIPDPEKNPSTQDLESLQPPDLLQALLLLEPASISSSIPIDPQLLALSGEAQDFEIYTNSAAAGNGYEGQREAGNSLTEANSVDLGSESDSDSSCISNDSITRNADFVAFN